MDKAELIRQGELSIRESRAWYELFNKITLTPADREELLDMYVAYNLHAQRNWTDEEKETDQQIRDMLEYPHGITTRPKCSDVVLMREAYQYGYKAVMMFMEKHGYAIDPV